jgi:hypothetical protein
MKKRFSRLLRSSISISSSVTSPLSTTGAITLFGRIKPRAKDVLAAFNDGAFQQGRDQVTSIRAMLTAARTAGADAEEQYLNDLFVLDRYVDFLSVDGDLWDKIVNQQFSSSWSSLQDALDLLRAIKSFSKIDIAFFETQLTELEKAYPYSVFASVGMLVERFDCSICGLDIDSDDCCHQRGQLYRGVMACAVAHKIVKLDHVSLVTEPEDKRCVVQYDDSSDHFKLVRLLGQLIASKKWRLSDFLIWSTRRKSFRTRTISISDGTISVSVRVARSSRSAALTRRRSNGSMSMLSPCRVRLRLQ